MSENNNKFIELECFNHIEANYYLGESKRNRVIAAEQIEEFAEGSVWIRDADFTPDNKHLVIVHLKNKNTYAVTDSYDSMKIRLGLS